MRLLVYLPITPCILWNNREHGQYLDSSYKYLLSAYGVLGARATVVIKNRCIDQMELSLMGETDTNHIVSLPCHTHTILQTALGSVKDSVTVAYGR